MDFYGAAAQVIPVLFLALVFESRVLDRQPSSYSASNPDDPSLWNVTQAIGRIWAIAILALGETSALLGLDLGARDREVFDGLDGTLHALVWGALLVGVLGTVEPLISRQWGYFKLWRHTEGRHGLRIVLFFSLLLTSMTVVWITFFN